MLYIRFTTIYIYVTRSRLVACIVLCWITSLAMAASVFLGPVIKTPLGIYCHLLTIPSHVNYLFVVNLSSVIAIIMYVRIYKEIHQQYNHINPSEGPNIPRYSSHAKSFIILLLTVGCFILCWTQWLSAVVIAIADEEMYVKSCALIM